MFIYTQRKKAEANKEAPGRKYSILRGYFWITVFRFI